MQAKMGPREKLGKLDLKVAKVLLVLPVKQVPLATLGRMA